MRFYSLTDKEVLTMPLVRFWLLQSNIGRLSAAEDMRLLKMHASIGGKQSFEEYREGLIRELGIVQKVEEKLDREGLKRLAALT